MTEHPTNITASLKEGEDGRQQRTFSIVMAENDMLLKLAGLGSGTSNAAETEDQFNNYYIGIGSDKYGVIRPPYNQDTLWRLAHENNALLPCIEAMVTNVDGTGYEFVADDLKPEDQDEDEEVKALKEFFNEPWPGESWTTIRKKLRRDIETVGNGYLEVVRNVARQIVFVRHVDAKMMRIVALDLPYRAKKKVFRGGVEVEIKTSVRERRYAQVVQQGAKLIYFREFGSTRELHKTSGLWETPGKPVAANARATEIIHFTAIPDATTPYGVPRWINQLPSILGSRKAEEFNMEFFDNGGIPPALILLQGGILSAQTRTTIESAMFVKAAKKQRIMVLEAEPTGGSLDNPGTARMTVERFGTERQNDSMFEKYDDKCEQRVRRAFRLPPIFVGASSDYNFATAYASYTVAEAQVFKPEREEFDEAISLKILPAFNTKRRYKQRSLPLQIQEATTKLKALQMARDTGHVEPAEIVGYVNEIAGLNLKVTKEQVMAVPGLGQTGSTKPIAENDLNDQTGLPNGVENPVAE